jgi:hypothetical protein
MFDAELNDLREALAEGRAGLSDEATLAPSPPRALGPNMRS